jgi:RES domain
MVDWGGILAAARPTRLAGALQRLVESQEQVATNQLVASLAQQSVLEEMLEATKPPLRHGTEQLHYLLATPFRYPPLKFGSRFGKRSEPSLFYGSLETRTVLAEAAYYRFAFWYGMVKPPPGKLDTQHTLFGAEYRTERGLQLQSPLFADYSRVLTDPVDYGPTQALGASMREAGIEAFEYLSARDPRRGLNVALFSPAALADSRPVFQDAWLCELTAEHVHFHAAHGREDYDFPLEIFRVNGELPWPS